MRGSSRRPWPGRRGPADSTVHPSWGSCESPFETPARLVELPLLEKLHSLPVVALGDHAFGWRASAKHQQGADCENSTPSQRVYAVTPDWPERRGCPGRHCNSYLFFSSLRECDYIFRGKNLHICALPLCSKKHRFRPIISETGQTGKTRRWHKLFQRDSAGR